MLRLCFGNWCTLTHWLRREKTDGKMPLNAQHVTSSQQ
jgi:hypothetical protein